MASLSSSLFGLVFQWIKFFQSSLCSIMPHKSRFDDLVARVDILAGRLEALESVLDKTLMEELHVLVSFNKHLQTHIEAIKHENVISNPDVLDWDCGKVVLKTPWDLFDADDHASDVREASECFDFSAGVDFNKIAYEPSTCFADTSLSTIAGEDSLKFVTFDILEEHLASLRQSLTVEEIVDEYARDFIKGARGDLMRLRCGFDGMPEVVLIMRFVCHRFFRLERAFLRGSGIDLAEYEKFWHKVFRHDCGRGWDEILDMCEE